jgi:3-oxoacyl-[acyl-carrier-protein] synthase II
MKRRVVVTGLGAITSLGGEVNVLWDGILAGRSGVHPLTILDVSNFKVRFGSDIPDFDPGKYVDAKEAKRLDRFTQFATYAAGKAIEDSGIDMAVEDPYRCGVILGSGIGGLSEIEIQVERLLTKGPDRVSPFTIPKLMLNAAGANISICHGMKGPNFTVATACASATNAMGDAFKCIQYDDADVIVTGGTEAAITAMGVAGFQNMKALSTRNEEPTRASRPFDADRDGFVMAEGAGGFSYSRNSNTPSVAARRFTRKFWDMVPAVMRATLLSRTSWDVGLDEPWPMRCETVVGIHLTSTISTLTGRARH